LPCMIRRKAADQENPHVGPQMVGVTGNVKTIELCTQIDIRDQHVWRTYRLGQPQSLMRIAGLNDLMTGIAEHSRKNRSDEFIVVHEQNQHGRNFPQFRGKEELPSLYATRYCLSALSKHSFGIDRLRLDYRGLSRSVEWE
jgi:hypothetical protein